MKTIGIWTLLLLLTIGGSTVYGQEKKSKKERKQEQAEKVQKMVEAQDYKFVAQRALPMSGRSINLTTDYDLQISKDTITAYLPYYGRAYIAPMDPTEGGIKFESKDFDYKLEKAKKDGWTVNITIKDDQRHYEMILSIFTNGSANLSVNDNTRQGISFDGTVEARKKNKN